MTPTLLAVVIGIGAPALKPTPPKGDPLVGRWVTTALVIGGKDSTTGNTDLEYEFTKDGRWIIYRTGKPLNEKVRTFTADTKKKPAAIDLTERDTGPYPGIYHVDGDTLTVIFQTAKGDRPKDLSDRGPGTMAFVMTRVKITD